MAKLPDDAKKEIKGEVEKTSASIKAPDVDNQSLADIMATLKSMQDEIVSLKSVNAELQDKAQKLQSASNAVEEVSASQKEYNADNKNRVKIRLNTYAMLHAEMPSLNLRMTQFGETRTITLSEFQQLIGLHPDWFKKEYLLVDGSRMDLVEDYPISLYDPNSNEFIHAKDITEIGKMDTTQLRSYYDKLSPKSQQGFVMMWMRKCYDADPDFFSVEKMEAVNSMSHSKTFSVLIRQLNSRDGITEA